MPSPDPSGSCRSSRSRCSRWSSAWLPCCWRATCWRRCPRPWPRGRGRGRSSEPSRALAPDLVGGLDDQAELGYLLVVGQRVALGGGGEAALPGQAELVQGDELGGLVDTALEVVLGLQLGALGGDQAEDDHLALGNEAERLEATGPFVVVLEEEPVHGQLGEQRLGHEVVAAGGDPGGTEVAAAHVRGDGHVRGLALDRVVDLLDVAQVEVLGVLAALADLGPL